ncbi:hypothetical protein RhiJN_16295 [Ceratobasidium sp. AG-Ba]|nr:hypothetical protein RhiJN_16295 [Ceratobasidium sp. AG-Ba]
MILKGLARLKGLDHLPPDIAERTCPYCSKEFSKSKSRDTHISMNLSCRAQHDKPPDPMARQQKRRRAYEPTSEPIEGQPPTKRFRTEEIAAPIAGPSKLPAPEPPSPELKDAGDGTYIEEYMVSTAGAPIGKARRKRENLGEFLKSCGRMGDRDLFESAEILMTTGLTGKGRTRHLKGPSYKRWKGKEKEVWPNDAALLRDVDGLPQGAKWRTLEVTVGEGIYRRKCTLHLRDILQVIRQLIGARRFEHCMRYAPERRWTSRNRKCRVYDEMWTGDWWWRMQGAIGNPTGTVVPLIIASDETTLANNPVGLKAHPIYLSIGNISKAVRRRPTKRAMVLLGYLPADSFNDITDDTVRQRYRLEQLHRSLRKLFEPLKKASSDGMLAWCADGYLRHIYPMVAAWIADWPEQNDLACTSQSGCPKCTQKRAGRSQGGRGALLRDREDCLETLRTYQKTGRMAVLKELDLRPVEPFWVDFPHVDLGLGLVPDLLHQFYKGMFEHVRNWVEILLGTKEFNRRFKTMPVAQDLRCFKKGVTTVANWTGRESRDMARQFLPVVIDVQAPNDFVRMIRALLDFAQLAHCPRLADTELIELNEHLAAFHRAKSVLVKLGVVKKPWFFDKIAKLHTLGHYVDDIREFGTPDGYSTETPEHLHIIYVKIPWRMSNCRNPFPQMIKYVRRLESIQIQRTAMDEYYGETEGADEDEVEQARIRLGELVQQEEGKGETETEDETETETAGEDEQEDDEVDGVEDTEVEPETAILDKTYYPRPRISLARQPTARNVPGHVIISSYGASGFIRATQVFLRLKTGQTPILLPSSRFDVWHKATFNHPPLPFAPLQPPHRDVVRVRPLTRGTTGRIQDAGVFDTALFECNPNGFGIARFCAGRVRAIFTLPSHLQHLYSGPLAFLDVYTPFISDTTDSHRLYGTTLDPSNLTSLVLPLGNLKMACHLAPDFSAPPTAHSYFLNDSYNYFTYSLLLYWRRRRTIGLNSWADVSRMHVHMVRSLTYVCKGVDLRIWIVAEKLFSVLLNSMCDERTGSRITFLDSDLRSRTNIKTMIEQIKIMQWYKMIEGRPKLKPRTAANFRDLPERAK